MAEPLVTSQERGSVQQSPVVDSSTLPTSETLLDWMIHPALRSPVEDSTDTLSYDETVVDEHEALHEDDGEPMFDMFERPQTAYSKTHQRWIVFLINLVWCREKSSSDPRIASRFVAPKSCLSLSLRFLFMLLNNVHTVHGQAYQYRERLSSRSPSPDFSFVEEPFLRSRAEHIRSYERSRYHFDQDERVRHYGVDQISPPLLVRTYSVPGIDIFDREMDDDTKKRLGLY